jgi:undecaprenyl-diphosphatase
MHRVSGTKRIFLYRLLLLIVLLLSTLALTVSVVLDKTGAFDAFFIRIIQQNKSSTMQTVMKMFTLLGNEYAVILIIALIGIRLWMRKAYQSLKGFLVISLVSFITEVSIKELVHRIRPISWLGITASGYSFPSGHSIMTFVIAMELIIILRRLNLARWYTCTVLLLIAASVGMSRVYLGVHWPSDVLGSWLMGSVIITAYPLLKKSPNA